MKKKQKKQSKTKQNQTKNNTRVVIVWALYQLTLASYSSIFIVPTWTAENGTTWAVSKVILTPSTVNIVQIDWANTGTETSISKSHCIY